MARITIDGTEYEVDETDNLLKIALSKGFDLPYFCWHPELDSVGACRQCAVTQYKDENDTQGKLVMACMTPAADGTRISISEEQASAFRAQVIEWLMINHPHDCPVCEEGGECHLQDMTLMTGHTQRRYRGLKRTHKNQNLGPFIGHEMNRCIACYRCVRYYRDYADGADLRVLGSHNNVYFGRETDGPFENEFSGNLVEVCPTGVFTDKTLGAQYTRKWDMQNAPGICIHCSLGCNTSPGERKGRLKRIQNRYHGEINHYFLCDRGRFGAGFVNREDRVRNPLRRNPEGVLVPQKEGAAFADLRSVLAGSDNVVGIGSPRASLEDNFALRHLVGADNFHNGMSTADNAASQSALKLLRAHTNHMPSLREVEDCDAVLVLGEDITQVAPRLALSLRQTVRNKHKEMARDAGIPKWHARAVRDEGQHHFSPLFMATPAATQLDDVATQVFHIRPLDIARLGMAVANALDDKAPKPDGLDEETTRHAQTIADALKQAGKPLIITGTSLGQGEVVRAAGNVMQALEGTHPAPNLFVTFREANSLGLAMMEGRSTESALKKVIDGKADTLLVMQNDLFERAPDTLVNEALKAADNLIVLDHTLTNSVTHADYALPVGSFAEADGTLVNNEGRAQRFFQVIAPSHAVQEGWRACVRLHGGKNTSEWQGMDEVIQALIHELPQFAGIEQAAPDKDARTAGMRYSRSPSRLSGRTSLYADEDVLERRPPVDQDSALSWSMEGYHGTQRPASMMAYAWAPGWDSNQAAITRFQDEIGGSLSGGDPGVRLLRGSGVAKQYARIDLEDKTDWLAVPAYHIFGSEAQSARAPAIAERTPDARFTLNSASAETLGLAAADTLRLTFGDESHVLPVTLDDSLPDRTIGVPVGLHGLTGLRLPAEVTP